MQDDLAWVFYFSLPVSFLLAFGIGANDLANRSAALCLSPRSILRTQCSGKSQHMRGHLQPLQLPL